MPTALFTYKIGKKPLCIGDELLVQISREAVKTKAPTVTGNLNLTGRYAVLTHGNTRIGVSSKIPKKERDAYKLRLQAYQNDRFGIIVRTNAKEAPFEAVVKEIEDLKKEYERLTSNAMSRVCFSCLKSAPPSYITDLKNAYMDGMQEIIVNDPDLYHTICSFLTGKYRNVLISSGCMMMPAIHWESSTALRLPSKRIEERLAETRWIPGHPGHRSFNGCGC